MASSSTGSVTFTLDGSNRSTTLPVLKGSLGPDVVDIRKLYADLGVFTFDPSSVKVTEPVEELAMILLPRGALPLLARGTVMVRRKIGRASLPWQRHRRKTVMHIAVSAGPGIRACRHPDCSIPSVAPTPGVGLCEAAGP